jgi:predicted thioredoxin/glutaredoxin
MSAAARLTLVQRHDCELCEEMLRQLTVFGARVALPPIEVVDVDADPQLRRRHGLEVPVLLLDGTVVCRQRLDHAELTRLLRGSAAAAPPP